MLKKRQALFLASSHCSGIGSESTDLTLPDFHRSATRPPRDDRYPALLLSAAAAAAADKVSDVEQLYDFGVAAPALAAASAAVCREAGGSRGLGFGGGGGCDGESGIEELKYCCPKLTLAGYSPVDNPSFADAFDGACISGNPANEDGGQSSIRFPMSNRRAKASCSLCVQRNCDCLKENEAGFPHLSPASFHDNMAALGGHIEDTEDGCSENTSPGGTAITTSIATSPDVGDHHHHHRHCQRTPGSDDPRENLSLHHRPEIIRSDFSRPLTSNVALETNHVCRPTLASKVIENT